MVADCSNVVELSAMYINWTHPNTHIITVPLLMV